MKEELFVLFETIDKLKEKYSQHKKKFTLDGKLVGDIGEVLVAEAYGLTLYPDNVPVHDGFVTTTPDREVQIKTSFNNYFYFPKDINKRPKYFIAINLNQDSSFEEIYNGPGSLIYEKLLKHLDTDRKYNYRLSVPKLKELNKDKCNTDKIEPIVPRY